jgi:hypothetical protein
MSPAYAGELTGSLILTFFVVRLYVWLTKKMLALPANIHGDIKRKAIAFPATLVTCVGLGTIGLGFENALSSYGPAVIFWIIVDIFVYFFKKRV